MEKIHSFNEYALEELRKLKNANEISNPLLISPQAKGNIMYIGQETNGWFDALASSSYSAKQLEEFYEQFFLSDKVRNTLFWKFIKEVVKEDNLSSSVVWTNTLIVGKKSGVGSPSVCDKIRKISVENLVTIYKCFNIERVICAAGPCNPYYDIYMQFLKEIGKNMNGYPNKEQRIIYSDDETALYINHPQYLWRKNEYDSVLKKTRQFIEK